MLGRNLLIVLGGGSLLLLSLNSIIHFSVLRLVCNKVQVTAVEYYSTLALHSTIIPPVLDMLVKSPAELSFPKLVIWIVVVIIKLRGVIQSNMS